MIQSQENCLSDNHRYTHARWGGDFDAAPALNFFPAYFCRDLFLNDCLCKNSFSRHERLFF
jgi:hypothetical protein